MLLLWTFIVIPFMTSFIMVFLLAFQQLNVTYDNRKAVIPVSIGIALADVLLVTAIANYGFSWIIIPMGLGGGCGCLVSMWMYRKWLPSMKDKTEIAQKMQAVKDGENPNHIDVKVGDEIDLDTHNKSRSEQLAETTNPKDLIGQKKPNLNLVPSAGTIQEALAMADGAAKYGPFNWREFPVQASIYIAAARRHIMEWFDGEEDAQDSGVHHLGHARACLGILLDCQALGNLIDDRPPAGPASDLIKKHTKESA